MITPRKKKLLTIAAIYFAACILSWAFTHGPLIRQLEGRRARAIAWQLANPPEKDSTREEEQLVSLAKPTTVICPIPFFLVAFGDLTLPSMAGFSSTGFYIWTPWRIYTIYEHLSMNWVT